ncbi:MAG: ACT domain-containing protein [Nitrososphaeria archaeon]
MSFNIKNYINENFSGSPSKLTVIRKMLLYGISVKNKKLYCNDVEIPYKSLAIACNVDQRVVKSAVISITSDAALGSIFRKIGSTVNLKEVATQMGFGVLVITAYAPNEPGIIASVSKIISDFGINIRQVIVDDPEFFEEPKLYIITEKPLPGEILPEIKKLKNVKSITLF